MVWPCFFLKYFKEESWNKGKIIVKKMTIRKARWSQRWSQFIQRPQHFHLIRVPVIGLDDGLLLLILELARVRSQIWPRPRAKEFKTSGSMGIWLFQGSNNHPSAWRGYSVSSLSVRAPAFVLQTHMPCGTGERRQSRSGRRAVSWCEGKNRGWGRAW